MSAGVVGKELSRQTVAGVDSSSSFQYQSRCHPESDCLTPIWETFDAFFETDFSVLQAGSSGNTADRASPNTTGTVDRFSQQSDITLFHSQQSDITLFHSQQSDITLFHMDARHCPKIRNTEFKALRGLVIGRALNFSGSCHWTAVVPEDQYISTALHFGQCSRQDSSNALIVLFVCLFVCLLLLLLFFLRSPAISLGFTTFG